MARSSGKHKKASLKYWLLRAGITLSVPKAIQATQQQIFEESGVELSRSDAIEHLLKYLKKKDPAPIYKYTLLSGSVECVGRYKSLKKVTQGEKCTLKALYEVLSPEHSEHFIMHNAYFSFNPPDNINKQHIQTLLTRALLADMR